MKGRDGVALGVGVAACAACCAGPIAGFLAAIGLGTVVGVAVFGIIGLLIAVLAIPVLIRHRRRRGGAPPVPAPTLRAPSRN